MSDIKRFESYDTVQVLRLIAAMMVVITHATFYVNTRIDSDMQVWHDGAQGVALFFVISGFVMSLSAIKLYEMPGGFKTFMLNRIIRIVPLYWAVNILKLFGLLLIPSAVFASPDFANVLLSLLFIPSRNSEGAIEAFYGVGWTLNFEMFFYVVFAISIMFFSRKRSLTFISAILASCFALSFIRQDSWPAVTYLFHPIIINFIWGLALAELVIAHKSIPAWISFILLLGGFYLVFMPPAIELYGLQYAAVVAGAVFLEPCLKGRLPRILTFGGDASYSLYLIHPVIGVAVAIALAKAGFLIGWLSIIAIAIVSFLCSSITYLYFEKPVTRWLKSRYLPLRNP